MYPYLVFVKIFSAAAALVMAFSSFGRAGCGDFLYPFAVIVRKG
jgi:hypothetical protein